MVKNGGKAKLCSFLAVYLGVFKTLSQDGTARHAFEMDEFVPAGRFTK
jgi:hypothetical protein